MATAVKNYKSEDMLSERALEVLEGNGVEVIGLYKLPIGRTQVTLALKSVGGYCISFTMGGYGTTEDFVEAFNDWFCTDGFNVSNFVRYEDKISGYYLDMIELTEYARSIYNVLSKLNEELIEKAYDSRKSKSY